MTEARFAAVTRPGLPIIAQCTTCPVLISPRYSGSTRCRDCQRGYPERVRWARAAARGEQPETVAAQGDAE